MKRSPERTSSVGGALLCGVLLAVACAAPASARYTPADGILSPRLARLARPAVNAAPEARQARALGLPAEGGGSLERVGSRVIVEIRFEAGILARLDDLRRAGAQVLASSSRYQVATVAVKPSELEALNSVPGATAAREALAPVTAATPCQGAVVSAGDAQLNAPTARTDFGVDGEGVTVGILSDSFAHNAAGAAADVASGDLPGTANPCGNTTPVNVLSEPFSSEAEDEGRAMAQIVHDVAPGAAIDFATADGPTELTFAKHIEDLTAAGADVIVDDVAYFEEPFFQDGPVAVAIEKAVAQGVVYLTAAGNDNLFEEEPPGSRKFNDNEIASWETEEFRDSNECPPLLEALAFKPDQCLDFDPGSGTDDTFGITVAPKGELIVDVQWAEPEFGTKADLDAYLLDAAGVPLTEAEGGTEDSVGKGKDGEGEPVELVAWENKTPLPVEVQLAIDRCYSTKKQQEEEEGGCNPFADDTKKPRVKLILVENGSGVTATEYPESSGEDTVGPTVYGHAGAPDALAVAAVPASNSNVAEFYTSRGPVTHYFGPVAGKTPAAPLPEAQKIEKPDIAASDCVATTFFVPSGSGFRFCGTSAAAPHAAGVAALALEADPAATPDQVAAGLTTTARQVGGESADAVGAGLIDAYAAVDSIALPPRIAFPGLVTPTKNNRPPIAFAANRPVTSSCSLDGASLQPCSSPFVPEQPLPDGPHTLLVRGIDVSGRLGQGEARFKVDTVAPTTFFRSKPRKNVRTRPRRASATFRFGSDDPEAGFICRFDGGLDHFCQEKVSRRFGAGVHVVRVKAVDPAGNVDATPARYRFKVRRVGSPSRRP
jgi:subtilisin family serine protease